MTAQVVRGADDVPGRPTTGTLSLFTTLIGSPAGRRTDFHDLSQPGLAALYREPAHNAPGAPVARLTGAAGDRNTALLLGKR